MQKQLKILLVIKKLNDYNLNNFGNTTKLVKT